MISRVLSITHENKSLTYKPCTHKEIRSHYLSIIYYTIEHLHTYGMIFHLPYNLEVVKIFNSHISKKKEQHTYQALGKSSNILFAKDTDISTGRPS